MRPSVELLNLITDRTAANVARLKELSAIGWERMTEDERHEWLYGLHDMTVYWMNGEPITLSDGVATLGGLAWSDNEILACSDGVLAMQYDTSTTNKGAYNAADLNRVEKVDGELSQVLLDLPDELKAYADNAQIAWDEMFDVSYTPESVTIEIKTSWNAEDIPLVSDMTRYLNNVTALRNAMEYDTPDLPTSMNKLGYSSANAIEQALKGLDIAIAEFRAQVQDYIDRIQLVQLYSNEIFCGEA